MSKPVVTRIAPSPTGSMHIGTARTALFNYLYARHTGGKYLLRIEDTDRERSTEENVEIILGGLDWLGLSPDEPAVFQYARAPLHAASVQTLLDTGHAYRCYMSKEETDALREAARSGGPVIRSSWRDRTDYPEGPYVIRFRGPLEGETIVDDLIKGPVKFANRELDDLILLRSDGGATYNLAVVVDDHDMGITHVIRGDDHLNNAARQSLIFKAFGWETPVYAHLPLIHGPDGAKLSKRHGAQAVGEFADMGYLPEGLRNYLARLGWGHGDDEVFTDEQAIAWFHVKDVVKAPARLDWAKLNHINNQHLRKADDERLTALLLQHLDHQGETVSAEARQHLPRVIGLVKEGAATLVDLLRLTRFTLIGRPVPLDEKTVNLLTEETRGRLLRLTQALSGETSWTAVDIENLLKSFAESEGIGVGKFGPALRGVLSGGQQAPDLASSLTALGREESLARLNDALCTAQ